MKRRRSLSVSASSSSSLSGLVSAAVALLAAVLLASPRAEAAEPKRPRAKIGVVAPQTVLKKLLKWQEQEDRLIALAKKAEKALEEKKKEIERVRAELDYFKRGSKDHDRRKADLAAKQQQLARLGNRLSRSLADESRAVLDTLQKEIRAAVKEYAVANGFDVVVDARSVFYVAGGTDISLKVAQQMNKRYKDEKAKQKKEEEEKASKAKTEAP